MLSVRHCLIICEVRYMKELSLNILDITENSLKAGSPFTEILLEETDSELTISIIDKGCGMKAEMLSRVTDPFCTSRTTRKVGLGIPFFKMQAEQTGGSFYIESRHIEEYPENSGTLVRAVFNKNHIDYTPLGEIVETVVTLIQGHPEADFYFSHKKGEGEVLLDTREVREQLGNEIPLNTIEVLCFIRDYLNEQYINL